MSTTIISIFLGIGLAAAVGFRVFLPLFVLSVASHFGDWGLNESFAWLGSTTAMITLGIAMLVEIGAYLIPWLDNMLDSIAVPLAGVAGTIVVIATVADLDPVVSWSLAIIAGGGTAAAVSGTSAVTRLTSTATTGGLANGGVAVAETGAATALAAVSVLWPTIAMVLVIVVLWVVFKIYYKLRPKNSKE
ncbi:MAG: DUF4126 domain-containing protein [Flavobacteriaceae bacterium]|nr:DUF4126 domain-containing protein [Flavobacteriaceae bacterium]